MKRIAKFMKVSKEQFAEGWQDTFGEISGEELERIYESVKLPKRATSGSAGYDFFSPLTFELKPQETIKIPTGIRVQMEEGWVLKVYPRSGLVLTAIIFIRIMRVICLLKLQMIPTKAK